MKKNAIGSSGPVTLWSHTTVFVEWPCCTREKCRGKHTGTPVFRFSLKFPALPSHLAEEMQRDIEDMQREIPDSLVFFHEDEKVWILLYSGEDTAREVLREVLLELRWFQEECRIWRGGMTLGDLDPLLVRWSVVEWMRFFKSARAYLRSTSAKTATRPQTNKVYHLQGKARTPVVA